MQKSETCLFLHNSFQHYQISTNLNINQIRGERLHLYRNMNLNKRDENMPIFFLIIDFNFQDNTLISLVIFFMFLRIS